MLLDSSSKNLFQACHSLLPTPGSVLLLIQSRLIPSFKFWASRAASRASRLQGACGPTLRKAALARRWGSACLYGPPLSFPHPAAAGALSSARPCVKGTCFGARGRPQD